MKLALAADPDMDTYLAGKSALLQRVLAVADLTAEVRLQIRRLRARTA